MRLLRLVLACAAALLTAVAVSAQDTVRVYRTSGKANEYVNVDSVGFAGKYMRVYSGGKTIAQVSATAIDSVRTTTAKSCVRGPLESYKLIYSAVNYNSLQSYLRTFADKVKAATGVKLATASGAKTDDTRFEILIGETGRPESSEVTASLPPNSWAIRSVNDKLVIAASDLQHLALALHHFDENILRNPRRTGKGYMLVTDADTLTTVYDRPQNRLNEILKHDHPFKLSLTHLLTQPAEGSIIVAQGAGGDDRYFYMVNRNRGDSAAIVYKYDNQTNKFVSKSPVFNGHHCNGLTVDTKNNRILVANGSGALNDLTVLDPETMQVTGIIKLPVGTSSISYNRSRDAYVGGAGGTYLCYYDKDFNSSGKIARTDDRTNFGSQDAGSDDDFVYFPMSPTDGGSQNIIVAYDWQGKYVRTIRYTSSEESESLFEVDGRYYVTFYNRNNGVKLCRLNINLVFE